MSAALGAIDLFAELAESECAALMPFLEVRDVDAGWPLFRSGDESGDLFVLVQGALRLEIDSRDSGQLSVGDVLGAVSLVGMGARHCTVLATEPSRVLALTRESYLRLRREHPSIALLLQEAIVRRLAGDMRKVLQAS